MYRNGDFVPWDIDAWAPALPSCMLGAAKAKNGCRGQLYTGDLTAYRDDRLGPVTRPSSWDGMRMKRFVEWPVLKQRPLLVQRTEVQAP